MGEKVLIKNAEYNFKKYSFKTTFLRGVIIASGLCLIPLIILCHMNGGLIGITEFSGGEFFWLGVFMPFWLIIFLNAISYSLLNLLNNVSIIVTNKRVYGKTFFGTRIDLPLDSISAVGIKWYKGIRVSTSSGIITFPFVKNAMEIHQIISELLIERQNKVMLVKQNALAEKEILKKFEELTEYKKLLDSNIITQAEFETKKQELLGL